MKRLFSIRSRLQGFIRDERGELFGLEYNSVKSLAAVSALLGVAFLGYTALSNKVDDTYQGLNAFADKLFLAFKYETSVPTSDQTSSLSNNDIPTQFRKNASGQLMTPMGAIVTPKGTGGLGFTLAVSGMDQDRCKALAARFAGENGKGRLVGIQLNTTVETLPVTLSARNSGCSATGSANTITLTYDLAAG